eukprot:13517967-Ditylum_brightwellii.AAC.1
MLVSMFVWKVQPGGPSVAPCPIPNSVLYSVLWLVFLEIPSAVVIKYSSCVRAEYNRFTTCGGHNALAYSSA